MISIESEIKLVKLLEAYIQGEKQTEASRLILAEIREFDPFAIFRKIDRHSIGYLTATDLLKFLRYTT